MMPSTALVSGWGGMPLPAEVLGHALWLGAVVWIVAEAIRSAAHATGAEFRALVSVLSLAALLSAAVVATGIAAPGLEATSEWMGTALWIWLAGLVVMAAYVGCGLLRISQIRRAAVPEARSAATDAVLEARRLLGVPQPVPVARSDRMPLPVLVGTVRPKLLLPVSAVAVRGWNEIDAVGLRDLDGTTQWAATVEASTTYAQQRQPVVVPVDFSSPIVPEEQPAEPTPETDRLEQLQLSIDELKVQVEQLQQLREELEALKPSREEQVEQ